MDLQDILFVLIFFIFSILPKKKKSDVFEEEKEDQTEVVRKKIEALKRKRNGTEIDATHTNTETKASENKPKKFSAYKHLPVYEQPTYEPQEIVKEPVCQKPKIFNPKPLPNALREKMKWHIILSKPVCARSFYGNFTNR